MRKPSRLESNSRVVRAHARRALKCSYCRPHQNENRGRKAKHGARKPRRYAP